MKITYVKGHIRRIKKSVYTWMKKRLPEGKIIKKALTSDGCNGVFLIQTKKGYETWYKWKQPHGIRYEHGTTYRDFAKAKIGFRIAKDNMKEILIY